MTRTTVPITKPAASYARISQKVERDKVADQHAQNAQHAASRGYRIVAEYTDDGIGALGDKVRPDFERMLLAAEHGDFEVIVATEEERLARNVPEKIDLHAACEAAGVVWDTIRDGYVDPATDSGEFMSTIRAAVGRIESRRKTRRQRAASDMRAAEGLPPVGNVGYGLRRDGDRLVVEPDEAAVIREAVRRILTGESLRAVAKDFNARGIAGPGKGRLADRPWSSTTLKQMLLRPSLAGLRKHRGVIVGDALGEQVIDRDARDRLVALLTDPVRRSESTGGHPAKHLLSGVAKCGRPSPTADDPEAVCGGTMRRIAGWTPKPDSKIQKATTAAYACVDCTRVRRKQEPVDDFITELVLGRLEMPDAADLFTRGDADAAKEAREAMSAIDAKLAIAADHFAQDITTADQFARITTRLREDRARHEATVVASMPSAIPADLVGPRARQVWATLDHERRRKVVATLLEVVIMPAGVGRSFDPTLIQTTWKAGR